MDNKIRVFSDTETTGLSFDNDRLIEFAGIVTVGENIVDTKRIILNPEIKIALEASAVHGFYDSDVASCPKFREAYTDILDLLVGNNVETAVFHNSDFDTTMLSKEFNLLRQHDINPNHYLIDKYPDFIPEKYRIYTYNKNNDTYSYDGKSMKELSLRPNEILSISDLFSIEDTLIYLFEFHKYKSNSLDGWIKELGIDKSTRNEFHGALIDSELLMKCFFKEKENNRYQVKDLVDIYKDMNGGQFNKLVIPDESRIDSSIANQMISLSKTNNENDNNKKNSYRP